MSTAAEPEKKPAKSKKLLIIVVVALLLLAIVGAGVLYFVKQRSAQLDEDGGETESQVSEPAVVPTFLPVDTMVVNLADPGGERFAQVGITLELADMKTADLVKQYMPTIRSSVLLLISQKTSAELLSREGKEALAHGILREVSRPLGYKVAEVEKKTGGIELPAEESKSDSAGKAKKGKDKRSSEAAKNPVHRVLFSGFIVQ